MILENILKLLEKKVTFFEKELFLTLEQIKKTDKFELTEVYFEKIYLIKSFLDSIYLSFDEELKIIINQRIGEKNKLILVLKDFDRIDDLETRKNLINKIKDGKYYIN